MPAGSTSLPGFERFTIGFDLRDRERLHALWDDVIDSGQWSHGPMTAAFEAAWCGHNGAGAVALSGWAGGALAALDFAGVSGRPVLCPSNTFMATPLAIIRAGGTPVFVDCNRDDLCVSFASFEAAAERAQPAAAMLVHIGGHLAFESQRIADYCRDRGIFLLEDCAHAHGAEWNGRRPGTFGDAGVYSFYATKTVSTGEGGVLVSTREEVLDHARRFRDYGKPDYAVEGLNFRMSEFTAALALLQTERLPGVVQWKNAVARDVLDARHPNRLRLPEGMTSGLYKYIVFSPLERSTGKVYEEPCHRILGTGERLPNTDWVATNHWCAPLYYRPTEAP
ncbi:MAG: perosamine synthetase [Solirubrobacteraceae bacterium]|nr:perosamine synthetase [Solirubrobacteraceae bacterium]